MIEITDHLSIGEEEISERFVRAAGPGGQNVKTFRRFPDSAGARKEDFASWQ